MTVMQGLGEDRAASSVESYVAVMTAAAPALSAEAYAEEKAVGVLAVNAAASAIGAATPVRADVALPGQLKVLQLWPNAGALSANLLTSFRPPGRTVLLVGSAS
jgi:hypothetical protein